MEKIYLVLTYTGSILSRAVRVCRHSEYGHISISLDRNLEEMYSFGRLNAYNAFIGGFVKESIDYGTFKRFKNTKALIFEIEVTKHQYSKIKNIIGSMRKSDIKYGFNFLGLVLVPFKIKKTKKNSFYCAEFIKYLFDEANLNYNMPATIAPDDFTHVDNAKKIYEGYLRVYKSVLN